MDFYTYLWHTLFKSLELISKCRTLHVLGSQDHLLVKIEVEGVFSISNTLTNDTLKIPQHPLYYWRFYNLSSDPRGAFFTKIDA